MSDLAGNEGTSEVVEVGINLSPVVDVGAHATIDRDETFLGSGSFADGSAGPWTATVDYGDGAGAQPLALDPDKTFALSHTYEHPGTFTATVTVTDDGSAIGSGTVIVTVNAATAEEVRLLKDVNGLGESAEFSNIVATNGTLFFVVDDTIHGCELWKSDGTEAGTVLVKDIWPGDRQFVPQKSHRT